MSKKSGASLFYRKDRNTWAVQYQKYDSNNKGKLATQSFKNKEDAKDFLEEIMYKKDNKNFVHKKGISLKTVMQSISQKKIDAEIISEGQYMRINKTIKQMPEELLNKDITEITEDEIQEYLNSLKDYSNSTIKKFYEQLSQSFRNAFERDYIKINPMKNIIRPKSNKCDKNIRPLTVEEQEKFTEFLRNADIEIVPYKNVFLFQMYLGMRVGEVLALKTTDIDLVHNLIAVKHTMSVDKRERVIMKDTPKSFNGMRELPIPEFLKPYIVEQINYAIRNNHIENLLFVNSAGNFVDHRGANKILKKILKDNFNIEDISTHSLRHTFGTRCVEGGMRDVALQRLMGHGSVSATLDNYVSISESYTESELEKMYDYFMKNNIMTN